MHNDIQLPTRHYNRSAQNERSNPQMHVTIQELSTNGRRWEYRPRTTLPMVEALGRCITRHFGRQAFFEPDSGLPHTEDRWYGQIFRSLPNTGSGWSATSLTDRVRVEIFNA